MTADRCFILLCASWRLKEVHMDDICMFFTSNHAHITFEMECSCLTSSEHHTIHAKSNSNRHFLLKWVSSFLFFGIHYSSVINWIIQKQINKEFCVLARLNSSNLIWMWSISLYLLNAGYSIGLKPLGGIIISLLTFKIHGSISQSLSSTLKDTKALLLYQDCVDGT